MVACPSAARHNRGVPGIDTCTCLDWDLSADAGTLSFRPSSTTKRRLLGAAALLVALAVVAAWLLGLFTLGDRSAALERQAASHEAKATKADARAAHLRSSASAPGAIGSQGAMRQAEAEAAEHRRSSEAARREAAALRADPSRGRPGAAAWVLPGFLVALGALLVGVGFREEIDLTTDGHTLRLRRRWQLKRSRDYRIDDFGGLGVHVQRVLTTHRQGTRIQDHGWRWSVVLLPWPEREGRMLVLELAQEPTLPPRVERLTPRVREAVTWLEAATGLTCNPPITTDVSSIEPTWTGQRWKLKNVRHGPADPDAKYRALP